MATNSLDNVIFKKKKFSDILEEIYQNQKAKEKTITGLILELKPLIKDTSDATILVPLIKEYLEIGVKNDEHLIKMATIIQRIVGSNSNDGDGFGITESEKKQLMAEMESLKKAEDANKKK